MFFRLLRDIRGNVLPTFAVAAVPLLVATGGVVDYSRAFDQRTVVQDALDAAALSAGKKIGLVADTAVKNEANNVYTANVGSKVTVVPALSSSIASSTITLNATLTVPTYFLGMIGVNQFTFPLSAQATSAMGTLEVVMALDNSGSMAGSKMSTLKSSAASLASTLWSLGATSTKTNPIEIGIVPFAASVNVGPSFQSDSTATWLDKTAVGPYQGDEMEANGASGVNNFTLLAGLSGYTWGGCVEERPQPYDATDDAAATSVPGTMYVPMFAPDEPDDLTATSSCSSTQKIGSGSSLRYNCAPSGSQNYNNYLPDIATPKLCGNTVTMTIANPGVMTTTAVHGLAVGDEVVFNTTGALPGGLTSGTTYYVKTVPTTKTFTVAATSGGTAIKTTGSQSGTQTMASSAMWTCANGNDHCASSSSGEAEETAFANMCKYGTSAAKVTPVSITVGGLPGGPNFMCTTPAITPLTTSSTTVTTAINNLVANGATNILSGIAWAWRVLSSGAPFTQGRDYSVTDNQKIIILMTDGENTYYPNSSFLGSWYAAFGYSARDHLKIGTTSASSSQLTTAMNARTLAACTNAKAAGIKIYTVGFEINSSSSSDPATALALLQNCASDTSKYFDAQNETALSAAFTAIGNDITLLRISQ